MSTTLSGSQEFTSLSRLHDAATSGDYDLVILDTPPAAHAVDFLRAPERLNAVFESAIVSLFMGRTTGLGLVATAWKQGVKVFLRAMTLLTGSAFVATLSDFFSAIDAIAPDIRETNLLAQQLLLDPSAAFVLISSFDLAKIQEGEAFHDELARAGYHLRKVIVNRAWPQWTQDDAAPRAAVRKALLARGERELAGAARLAGRLLRARAAPCTRTSPTCSSCPRWTTRSSGLLRWSRLPRGWWPNPDLQAPIRAGQGLPGQASHAPRRWRWPLPLRSPALQGLDEELSRRCASSRAPCAARRRRPWRTRARPSSRHSRRRT